MVTQEGMTLDCRGLFCPEPLLRTISTMDGIRANEQLTVLLSSPAALEDIAAWAKGRAQLISRDNKQGYIEVLLEKQTSLS
ncbi:MAG: sulfurtransferase TusA family protein [Thaumarchaeota archaeon]|nr:sulfurtransferase TusA family protein [Nitrososphaerota archaeon]